MAIEAKVVVTFLYPRKNMSFFNIDYYLKHHIPTREAAWTPLGMTNSFVCDIEKDAEFEFMVITIWKNQASWDEAKKGEAAQKLAKDVSNFTDVKPVTVVGKEFS
jgi:hypothetical protein